ncbi:MAG: oligosaccharide flippase family protein, partial [Magnetospirillum sp.]|nr:oligosaccharide flippase family protein [Magnetospirillum sp.]
MDTGAQLLGHGLAVSLVLTGAGVMALPLRELAVVLIRIALLAWIGAVRFGGWRWVTVEEWRALFRETRDVWFDGVIEGGFARLVVLASGWAGGAHGAGIFSQAMRLALVPHQFLSPVVSRLYANLFSRLSDEIERRQVLVRVGIWTGLGLTVAACFAVALAA